MLQPATSPLRDTLTALCDVAGSRFLHYARAPRGAKHASSPASPTQLTTQQIVVRVEQGTVEWRSATGSVQRHRLPLNNIVRVRVGLPHEMQQCAMYFVGSGGASHVFCLCTTRNKYMVLCAPNARKLDKWVGCLRQEVFRAQHVVGAGTRRGLTAGSDANSKASRRSYRRYRGVGGATAAGTVHPARATRRSLFQDQKIDQKITTTASSSALTQLARQPGLNRLGRKVLSALDPICHAASRGDSRAVESIVRYDQPHASAIESALFLAASAGHEHCVEPLLRVSASFFRHADGTTVMHAAVKSRNAECVRVIAQYYFDLTDVADAEGNTPLHLAVKAGDANCLLALLQSAAETSTSNKWGKTPLALAREERRKARQGGGTGNASKIVRMLKDYGAQTVTPYVPPERSSGTRGPTDMDRIMKIWNAFFENAMRWRMGEDLRENGGGAAPAAPPASPSTQGRKHAWAEPIPRGAAGDDQRRHYDYDDYASQRNNGGEEKSTISEGTATSSSSREAEWESCWDVDSGRWFWYNKVTGRSVWDEEWSDEGEFAGYDATAPRIEVETNVAADWNDGQVYETHFDESTGRWYYVNMETGHSTWADEWDSTSGESSAAATLAAAATPQSLSTPGSLAVLPCAPPGVPTNDEWETRFDGTTSRYYYVSHATGESVWGDSVLDSSNVSSNIRSVVMNFDNFDAHSVMASMPAVALASSWEILFDEATGHYYHSNTTTGESQWVVGGGDGSQLGQQWQHPQQQQQEPAPALALPAWQVPDTADPWDKVLDAESGLWYWVHKESGESVWADEDTSTALELNVGDTAWDVQLQAAAQEEECWDVFVDQAGNQYEISRLTGVSRWKIEMED